jgi:hypothetical protein
MSEAVRPFDSGGWFPVYNLVFDEAMPRLGFSAWKVLCVVMRQTWGWAEGGDPRERKRWDIISYSQFMEKAGIGSPNTVSKALRECIDAGYLERRPEGKHPGSGRTIYAYAMNTDPQLEPSASAKTAPGTSASGADNGPVSSAESIVAPSTETVVGASAEIVLTKETTRETQTNSDATALSSDGKEGAYQALLDIGFLPKKDAKQYANNNPNQVLGWARYAKHNGLMAGFVRNRLDAGEDPPPVLASPPPRGKGRVYR